MYRHGALAPLVRRRADREVAALFPRAAARMAIGDAMAAEYLERYGVPFAALQNSVDLPARDALAALHRDDFGRGHGAPVTMVYGGRVGQANAKSLLDVARAISTLAAEGTPVTLRVYTASNGHPAVAAMAGLPAVEILPPVAYDLMPALLEAADVLLLPLDFDEASVRFARLSMPTKIPEYMAAARPVLTYAPRGCATAEYARTGGWSLLVDQPDSVALRSAIVALATDPALRTQMGTCGRRRAEADHDARRVREQFRATLEDGAGPRHS
jgi:glycosyltransferase involved in cell wall biosynthesis